MAKRFISTEILDDSWVTDLPNKYKLFWLFLITKCDHSGVWQVNYKVASFYVGEHLEPSECERIMKDRIVKIDDGKYWFIPKFVEFQYGAELKDNNKAHLSVIRILKKFNVLDFLTKTTIIEGATKGLPRGYQAPKDKDKDKDMDMDKDKNEEMPSDEMTQDLMREFIRGFKKNPGEVELDALRKYVDKYGMQQLKKNMKAVALRGIKSLQYFLDSLDDEGNLKPYKKNDISSKRFAEDDDIYSKPYVK